MARASVLLIVLVSIVGLGSMAQSGAGSVDPAWKVPEKAAQRRNPLLGKTEAAAGGRKLFERMCVSCHGDETHGQANNAPDLGGAAVQGETDGALFWRISNGNSRKGMPSFSGLPEMQRWQLVLYIRSCCRSIHSKGSEQGQP